MRIRITTQKMPLSDALRELVHTRVRYALDRFDHRIVEANVSFEDLNGSRCVKSRIRRRWTLRRRTRGSLNVGSAA